MTQKFLQKRHYSVWIGFVKLFNANVIDSFKERSVDFMPDVCQLI